jgi:hypothetical protein
VFEIDGFVTEDDRQESLSQLLRDQRRARVPLSRISDGNARRLVGPVHRAGRPVALLGRQAAKRFQLIRRRGVMLRAVGFAAAKADAPPAPLPATGLVLQLELSSCCSGARPRSSTDALLALDGIEAQESLRCEADQ